MIRIYPSFIRNLAFFAVCLAFIVVVLGAYTRATDAGLGCPDWPGCYKQLTAPNTPQKIQSALQSFPNANIQVTKAWTEMVHRYVAGSLALLIVILVVCTFYINRQFSRAWFIPILLVGLLVFQILLGMWTVTMKLAPIVVSGHLFGGMTILALLWCLFLSSDKELQKNVPNILRFLQPWAVIGLFILILQMALGAWTSTHYAALICPDFPYCSFKSYFPKTDFTNAFNLTYGIHGLKPLSEGALISIHMIHRIGALITAVYLGLLSIYLMTGFKNNFIRRLGMIILLLLCCQVILGILNVIYMLPLSTAVLHNAMAALLLLALVTLNYFCFSNREINS
jgi:cytochrome c oxidase assembly protein subunit 15